MGMSSLTGGGGLSASSSAASRSGDASGLSGSGNKVFNFGANPNMGTAQVAGILTNPLVIGGVVIGLWLVFRRKK
jgi:exo-beta-1,3-glucanase (GH17 family)